MAQLESLLPSTKDPFARLFLFNPFLVFVKGNTNRLKNFKIERLLNKRQVQKKRGQVIKYLVC